MIGAGRNGRPFFPTFVRETTTLVDSLGHSVYDSLQTKLDRRMSSGLTMGIACTWSKALGLCCNSSNDGGPAIHARQYLDLARSLLSFDRPHNFQSTFTWHLPFGHGRKMATGGPASWILGGWQINGLLSLYSGSPFSVGADGVSLNMPGSSQRADVTGESTKLGGYGRGLAWYDWRTFAPVRDARFGTAGYNTLRNPGIRNLDLGVFRSFRVNERVNVQCRGEAQREQHAAIGRGLRQHLEPAHRSQRQLPRWRVRGHRYRQYGPRRACATRVPARSAAEFLTQPALSPLLLSPGPQQQR